MNFLQFDITAAMNEEYDFYMTKSLHKKVYCELTKIRNIKKTRKLKKSEHKQMKIIREQSIKLKNKTAQLKPIMLKILMIQKFWKNTVARKLANKKDKLSVAEPEENSWLTEELDGLESEVVEPSSEKLVKISALKLSDAKSGNLKVKTHWPKLANEVTLPKGMEKQIDPFNIESDEVRCFNSDSDSKYNGQLTPDHITHGVNFHMGELNETTNRRSGGLHKAILSEKYNITDLDFLGEADEEFNLQLFRERTAGAIKSGDQHYAATTAEKILAIVKDPSLTDVHEIPRYNCSLFLDLDGKGIYDNIHDMFSDLVELLTHGWNKLMEKTKQYSLNKLDVNKFRIHYDDSNVISLHIIYNETLTFENSAYQRQFWHYIKYLASKSDQWEKISKCIDLKPFNTNASIRTIGSTKRNESRKMIVGKWNAVEGKIEKDYAAKICSLDIITKRPHGHSCFYRFRIPIYSTGKNKHNNLTLELKDDTESIKNKCLELVPESYFTSSNDRYLNFNFHKEVKCIACETSHQQYGWYCWISPKGKCYAGCRGNSFKKSKLIFNYDVKASAENSKQAQFENLNDYIIQTMELVKKSGVEKKWSFSDYTLFVNTITRKMHSLTTVIEYLSTALVHVVNNGGDKIFTRNWHYDDKDRLQLEFQEIKDPFVGRKDFKVKFSTGEDSWKLMKMSELYYNYVQHYFKLNKSIWHPYLKKSQVSGKKFEESFNLFRGYAHKFEETKPEQLLEWEKNELAPIFWHFKYILCGGEEEVYDHFIKSLMFKIQHPTVKWKFAFSSYSKEEQAGKNICLNWFFKDIVGSWNCRRVNSFEDVTLHFNGVIANNLFIMIDEVAGGNKERDMNKFKNLMCENENDVTKKHEEAKSEITYSCFFLNSNNRTPIANKGSTNKIVDLELNCMKVGDFKYFDKLAKCQDDNSEKFFLYLANYDLGDFKPWRNKPVTKLSKEKKESSLSTAFQMLLEVYRSQPEDFVKKDKSEDYDSYDSDSEIDDDDLSITTEKPIATLLESKHFRVKKEKDKWIKMKNDTVGEGVIETGIFQLYRYVTLQHLYTRYKEYHDNYGRNKPLSRSRFIDNLRGENIKMVDPRPRVFGKRMSVFKLDHNTLKKMFDAKNIDL